MKVILEMTQCRAECGTALFKVKISHQLNGCCSLFFKFHIGRHVLPAAICTLMKTLTATRCADHHFGIGARVVLTLRAESCPSYGCASGFNRRILRRLIILLKVTLLHSFLPLIKLLEILQSLVTCAACRRIVISSINYVSLFLLNNRSPLFKLIISNCRCRLLWNPLIHRFWTRIIDILRIWSSAVVGLLLLLWERYLLRNDIEFTSHSWGKWRHFLFIIGKQGWKLVQNWDLYLRRGCHALRCLEYWMLANWNIRISTTVIGDCPWNKFAPASFLKLHRLICEEKSSAI